MPLSPGSRLGVYSIRALIGEGGMGQVYQARDTRLDRDVAIKVLPQEFVADPERVARFEREAKTLASLNHPHIGGIYGLEDADGLKALVLELVEGPTLADRIAQGALPIDEALPIARQIAEALEAAHEQGIIHRDLKPANIKVRQDGTVKVLDFGLAKAVEPGGGGASRMSMSPTLSLHATYAGVILGTAAYMSPEQARGRVVDRRTDVWAFGCVLFEMLGGARPFDGEDLAETIGAVIHKDPAWDRLPAATPGTVRRVLQRCLQKDPKERIRDIGDVQLALKGAFDVPTEPAGPATQTTVPPRPLWKRSTPVVSAAILAGAIVGGAAWMLRPPEPVQAPVVRFSFPLGEGQLFTVVNNQMLAVSPDGKLITYVANNQLYLRKMSDLTTSPIGTQQRPLSSPVFSPDSRWIAFVSNSDQTIKKISVSGGGAAITVCPAQPSSNGRITWDGETILFGQPAGVMRVSANSGEPELIVKVEETESVHGPQLLPGGEWVLFTLRGASIEAWDKAKIVVQSLKTSERRTLINDASDGRYLSSGHLVYAVAGVLYAVPFDLQNLAVAGDRMAVVEGIRRALTGYTAATQFSVSNTGSLVYVSGPAAIGSSDQSDIALIDREGNIAPLKLPPGPYHYPRLSPDRTRLAVGKGEGGEDGIWIYDMSGVSGPPRRLTLEGRSRLPVWAPDNKQIAFQSDHEGDWAIFRQRVDDGSSPQRLTKPALNERHFPESWSPDGRTLLFSTFSNNEYSLQALSVTDGKATPFGNVQSPFPTSAAFSPDGKWVAYSKGVPGIPAGGLFVQPFPPTGKVFAVAPNFGMHPAWSADSKELIYLQRGSLASVRVTATGSAFAFGRPVLIPRVFSFNGPSFERDHDLAKDGRLLGVVAPGQTGASGTQEAAPELQVVLNWFTELKERVPRK